jgi:two-component system, NarL family, sensor histidine kinase DesK
MRDRDLGGDDVPRGDPGRLTARKWHLMASGWSLVLLLPAISAATSDHPPVERVLLVLAVVAYAACYVLWLYAAMTRPALGQSVALLVVMALLWVPMAAEGNGMVGVAYLIVSVVVLVPARWGIAAALLTSAAAVATVWLLRGSIDPGDVISTVAISLAMVGMFGLVRINQQLRDAREELAGHAVTAERERMARDLHDVLGHSLTTITVKAGLARRLLERGDAARAADEVADMERLGRQALADVRATVSASRVASLARELAGAREALRAAGIEADLPLAVDDVPADRQQAFAFVVREGVTNAIRHSGASRVTVSLTPTSVEVVDDGVGSPAGTPAGNGISGLTERLAAIGGWVDAGPTPQGGYRLRAECRPAHRDGRGTPARTRTESA